MAEVSPWLLLVGWPLTMLGAFIFGLKIGIDL